MRHIGTNEEEDDSETTTYRYVPRTLLQGGPFYASANEGRAAGSSGNNDNKKNSNYNSGGQKIAVDRHGLYRSATLPSKATNAHRQADNNYSGTPLNLSATDLYDDMAGSEQEQEPRSSSAESAAEHQQPRNLTLDDIDIESIHGKDHYGKLEATPVSDHQDKLWTEIDALDDVKRLASSENMFAGFPAGFEEKLERLRKAHSHLLRTMRERDAVMESGRSSESNGANGLSNKVSRVMTDVTGAGSTNPEYPAGFNGAPSLGLSAAAVGYGEESNASIAEPNNNKLRARPPSLIQSEEDRYVHEITDIIKQLRT